MQFVAAAEQYDRFMGRYAPSLAVAFADVAGVAPGMRVVDVGCGPGGLTGELVARLGAANVAAIDPAAQFSEACRTRNPGADVRVGVAERLPWSDGEFDASLSSLVLGFMQDPDRGVQEMARVTRPGGTVAACMWDIAEGGMTMLRVFWGAVRTIAPGALVARADYADFDDFWEPFTFAIGPSGQFLHSLPAEQQQTVRELCRHELSDGPFSLDARAWYARGTVPAPGAS
jgi:ubiquinone/menaquinone biosynthesis C-methylase UbiE